MPFIRTTSNTYRVMRLLAGDEVRSATIQVPGFPADVYALAILDPLEIYRYVLARIWDHSQACMIAIMLNPSTATHLVQDATIRKLMGLARRMGYGGVIVLNLFAFRGKDPQDMKRAVDPVGPMNNEAILHVCHHRHPGAAIVCAWGTHGAHRDRDVEVCEMLEAHGHKTMAFSLTKDGHPAHPLYLPNDTKLIPFSEKIS